MSKLQDNLAYPPRGMDADHAAAYCGLSKTKFLEGVESGAWPRARDAGGCPRWDRVQLDKAWDALDERRKRRPGRLITLEEALAAKDGQGGNSLY